MFQVQKPKSHRDPNAPKRNLSAYLLYQNAMRDHFKALNPSMTFGQLAKYTSAMYSELSPHEKAQWVERAEADKHRFLQELSTYIPPPGYDSKGDLIVPSDDMMRDPHGYEKKLKRDENAPKRNLSAYLLFQNGMREIFKRENPSMTFGQLAKYTAHMYKNLSPAEKASWDARALEDKARFEREMQSYVPPPMHDEHGYLAGMSKPKKRLRRMQKKDMAAPKRASGAYVFFTNEMRPMIMREYPTLKFTDLGRVMGERWRALSPDQKKRYEDMAAQDKMRFQIEMQQYSAQTSHQLAHAMAQHQALHLKPVKPPKPPAPRPVKKPPQPQPQIHPQMHQHQYPQYSYPAAPQYLENHYQHYDPYMHQYH